LLVLDGIHNRDLFAFSSGRGRDGSGGKITHLFSQGMVAVLCFITEAKPSE